MDITLSTVKVRNFDKTITTYALIADSFKNWRGMKECGGRRIKRALHIDINSICFCDQDMTFLVRQLSPTANGLPLKIYVFCKDNTWAVYEEVQADIFDHLSAIAPGFDLRVYQLPSGRDVNSLENIFKEGWRVSDGS